MVFVDKTGKVRTELELWAEMDRLNQERERDEAVAAVNEEQARDRDETRRLLYMALVASRTERYNLVGTLMNALLHHSGYAADLSANEVADRLVSVVNGEDTHREWVNDLIERAHE